MLNTEIKNQIYKVMLKVVFITALVAYVSGYMRFQEQIPNGDYIPHPCKPNFVWKGVGHLNQAGGGERNLFGKDFEAAGKKWTTQLCQKDSDGDGISNGVELGDPNCIWTPGTIPAKTAGISHPGICDPWGSSQCEDKNTWVNCESDEFKCPAIHEEGVLTTELRFPLTNVPDKETTYMCMGFDLPSDGDYHLIATTPIINETNVMHHIVLIGCEDDSDIITEPRECSMGFRGCTSTVGLWTLGLPGECFYKEAGFRLGPRGLKRGVLQFHWTNPERRSDYYDASGMTIYYTKNLRKYDASVLTTGQQYLEIPPLSPKIVQHSTCKPKCTTKEINGSIFLTTGLNHMHYLGVSEYIKLIRSDGTELMLTDDKHYSYDTPVLNQYDPPIEMKPGDRIETVCTYRSLSRKKTATFGEGTFDEMCYGIFGFYPAEAAPNFNCVTIKDFDLCDMNDRNCDFSTFLNFSNSETRSLLNSVLDACSYEGHCLHGCRKVVDNVLTTHNCFKDGMADGLTYGILSSYMSNNDTAEALRFVAAMKSCDCATENPIEYKERPAVLNDPADDTSGSMVNVMSCVSLISTFVMTQLY